MRADVASDISEVLVKAGGADYGKHMSPDTYHVTLFFLGGVKAQMIPRIADILSKVAQKHRTAAPIQLRLGDPSASRNVNTDALRTLRLSVGCTSQRDEQRFMALREDIIAACIAEGLGRAPPKDRVTFPGHVTLYRFANGSSDAKCKERAEAWTKGALEGLRKDLAPSRWNVNEFTLFQSVDGKYHPAQIPGAASGAAARPAIFRVAERSRRRSEVLGQDEFAQFRRGMEAVRARMRAKDTRVERFGDDSDSESDDREATAQMRARRESKTLGGDAWARHEERARQHRQAVQSLETVQTFGDDSDDQVDGADDADKR